MLLFLLSFSSSVQRWVLFFSLLHTPYYASFSIAAMERASKSLRSGEYSGPPASSDYASRTPSMHDSAFLRFQPPSHSQRFSAQVEVNENVGSSLFPILPCLDSPMLQAAQREIAASGILSLSPGSPLSPSDSSQRRLSLRYSIGGLSRHGLQPASQSSRQESQSNFSYNNNHNFLFGSTTSPRCTLERSNSVASGSAAKGTTSDKPQQPFLPHVSSSRASPFMSSPLAHSALRRLAQEVPSVPSSSHSPAIPPNDFSPNSSLTSRGSSAGLIIGASKSKKNRLSDELTSTPQPPDTSHSSSPLYTSGRLQQSLAMERRAAGLSEHHLELEQENGVSQLLHRPSLGLGGSIASGGAPSAVAAGRQMLSPGDLLLLRSSSSQLCFSGPTSPQEASRRFLDPINRSNVQTARAAPSTRAPRLLINDERSEEPPTPSFPQRSLLRPRPRVQGRLSTVTPRPITSACVSPDRILELLQNGDSKGNDGSWVNEGTSSNSGKGSHIKRDLDPLPKPPPNPSAAKFSGTLNKSNTRRTGNVRPRLARQRPPGGSSASPSTTSTAANSSQASPQGAPLRNVTPHQRDNSNGRMRNAALLEANEAVESPRPPSSSSAGSSSGFSDWQAITHKEYFYRMEAGERLVIIPDEEGEESIRDLQEGPFLPSHSATLPDFSGTLNRKMLLTIRREDETVLSNGDVASLCVGIEQQSFSDTVSTLHDSIVSNPEAAARAKMTSASSCSVPGSCAHSIGRCATGEAVRTPSRPCLQMPSSPMVAASPSTASMESPISVGRPITASLMTSPLLSSTLSVGHDGAPVIPGRLNDPRMAALPTDYHFVPLCPASRCPSRVGTSFLTQAQGPPCNLGTPVKAPVWVEHR